MPGYLIWRPFNLHRNANCRGVGLARIHLSYSISVSADVALPVSPPRELVLHSIQRGPMFGLSARFSRQAGTARRNKGKKQIAAAGAHDNQGGVGLDNSIVNILLKSDAGRLAQLCAGGLLASTRASNSRSALFMVFAHLRVIPIRAIFFALVLIVNTKMRRAGPCHEGP